MINQLDKVLRKLLIYDLPIKNGEVEIAFEQPKGKWAAELTRPTLNLFLYDVRENTGLREPEWEIKRNGDGKATRQRKPVRLDLFYMITVWAATPDDEHYLATRVLKVLFRHPCLPPPEDVLYRVEDKAFWQDMIEEWPEVLRDQPAPISLRAAQADILQNPAEIWSALNNELRPTISCALTIALNPYEAQPTSLVLTRQLKFASVEAAAEAKTEFAWQAVVDDAPKRADQRDSVPADQFWLVGGRVRSKEPLANLKLRLVERGLEVLVREDGRFVIGNLDQGDYTLELAVEGRGARQHRLIVPSPNYDLEI